MNTIVVFTLVLGVLFVIKRASFNKQERYFGFYIIIAAIFEILAKLSSEIVAIDNNLPGLHLYTLLEFVALTYFFGLVYRSKGINFSLGPTLMIGAMLIILNSLFVESIYTYNSNSKTGTNVLYIIACFYYFYLSLVSKRNGQDEEDFPVRLFVASILIKTSLSIFYYLFSNYIMTLERETSLSLMYLNIFGNLLALFLVLIGFVKIIRRVK